MLKEEDGFTNREIRAYERYKEKKGAPISPDTALNFFRMYLEGYSLTDIHSKHRAWPLGALVDACIRYGWKDKKEEYLDTLQNQVMERLGKIKLESLNFALDMATVAHKQFRDEMMKYVQNPDDEKPPKIRIKSIREYKELMNIIMSLGNLGEPVDANSGPSTAIQVNVSGGGKVEVLGSNEKARLLADLASEDD